MAFGELYCKNATSDFVSIYTSEFSFHFVKYCF